MFLNAAIKVNYTFSLNISPPIPCKLLKNNLKGLNPCFCGTYLLSMFKQNNVKSLKTDMYQITYVPESITRTFDKSSFFKAHPFLAEEAEKYHKISPKADYLKITIK